MNFLFWNLNNKDLSTEVAELCEIHDIDVLMLGESHSSTAKTLIKINEKNNTYYYAQGTICEKIAVFSKLSANHIAPIEETTRMTVRKLFSIKYGEVLLVIIHFQSKMNWSLEDQAAHTPKIKELIDRVEKRVGHQRTIVCGDFNMNPFDFGLVQSSGLHAVMEKQIAQKHKRTIDGDDYVFFYNPMWGFLGDLGRGEVSGTFYYNPAKPISYHWNIFDQVLIRPDLLLDFDDSSLEIITKIGHKNLITQNKTINSLYSDHLPIKFTLKI